MPKHYKKFTDAVTFWGFVKYLLWTLFSLEAEEERQQYHAQYPERYRIDF